MYLLLFVSIPHYQLLTVLYGNLSFINGLLHSHFLSLSYTKTEVRSSLLIIHDTFLLTKHLVILCLGKQLEYSLSYTKTESFCV